MTARDYRAEIPLIYRWYGLDYRGDGTYEYHYCVPMPPDEYKRPRERRYVWRAGTRESADRLSLKWYVQRIWARNREVRRPGE